MNRHLDLSKCYHCCSSSHYRSCRTTLGPTHREYRDLLLCIHQGYLERLRRLFSLSQTSKFPVKQLTRARGIVPDIPYYVGRNFNALYRRDPKLMVQVEQAVQREYYQRVQERCQQEKVARKRKLHKAKKSKDKGECAVPIK